MATKRTRRHFDLEAAARQLFEQARAKADFSGAASVLRLLRDLRPSADAKPTGDSGIDVSTLTDAEFEELGRLLEPFEDFKTRVRRRLGLDPTPNPTVITEPNIDAVTPPTVEPAPLPFDLFPDEIIRDGYVIEIDPETGEEILIGSIENVAAEGRAEEADDESA